ncbi:hypothetical protein ACIOD2_32405 [Amycolatopsis sp. NPDC088138]|uniref:hypothetical protein n=1 Tax=Amycolatopsis sp. NPDC088138 TaxID=3363938 RepID=UPI00380AFBEA
MPKFRLDGVEAPRDGVTILGKVGSPDAFDVAHDSVIEVAGEVDTKDAPEDAVIVVNGDTRAAWPTAIWSLVEEKPAKTPVADKSVKEN